MHLIKHILDYRKKQTGTLQTSENITFTNDDVMKYAPDPPTLNPALTLRHKY